MSNAENVQFIITDFLGFFFLIKTADTSRMPFSHIMAEQMYNF